MTTVLLLLLYIKIG